MPLRAQSFTRASFVMEKPAYAIELDAGDRHLRRKLLPLAGGRDLLVELDSPVKLESGDCLVLEDGRLVRVVAAEEDLMEVTARDTAHLTQLAWHIGNRHIEAQIETTRILIRRDHVIGHMLQHQGAKVRDVREPFSPESGAYHAHGPGQHEH
jgi:urease accessory protein